MGRKKTAVRQISVATKISAGFGLLIFFLLAAVGFSTCGRVEKLMARQFQEKGEAVALTVATLARERLQAGDYGLLNELFAGLQKNGDVKEAAVVTPGGKVVAHTDPAMVGGFAPDEYFQKIVRGGKSPAGPVFRAPISSSEGAIFGYFYIEMDPQGIRLYTKELLVYLGLTLLAAVYAGTMLARVITARVLKQPINDLLEATRHISTGNFTYRVPVRKEDELGSLARAFNTMTAHLTSLFRTVSTSTEEMAKSSQIILSRTESYLSSAGSGEGGTGAAGLAEIKSAARRLARVVDRLNNLSRQFKTG
ncbi:MAG: HAMP domain-containing protein [Acidothermus sp.]|nr:HAMP domain-containing protein [Acidothermus sp.]